MTIANCKFWSQKYPYSHKYSSNWEFCFIRGDVLIGRRGNLTAGWRCWRWKDSSRYPLLAGTDVATTQSTATSLQSEHGDLGAGTRVSIKGRFGRGYQIGDRRATHFFPAESMASPLLAQCIAMYPPRFKWMSWRKKDLSWRNDIE